MATKDWKTVPCGNASRPGCGKPIVWALDENSKRIPLDPRAPVYRVVENEAGETICWREPQAMVSHFATCSHANEFSRSKKHDVV